MRIACLSLLCLSLLAVTTTVPAQLSGTYTIDPNGSGARNYKTFGAASTALNSFGISASVLFRVAPGTYSRSFAIQSVLGTSQNRTVTFQSATRGAARFDVTKARVTMVADWAIFDGFVFSAGQTSLTGLTVTGQHDAVRNCTFTNCSLVIRGFYAHIHDNLFERVTDKPAIVSSSGDVDVHRNEIRMTNANYGAIVLNNSMLRQQRSRIFNNLIWGTVPSVPVITVYQGTDFVHNTILVTGGVGLEVYSTLTYFVPVVANNIVVQLGAGHVIGVSATRAGAGYFKLHNNLYHNENATNGQRFHLRLGGGAWLKYTTLASWQTATKQEAGSLYGDPLFRNPKSTPPVLDLKGQSPAIGKAAGTPSYASTDYRIKNRKTPATIGAYEVDPGPSFEPFGKGCPGTLANQPQIGYAGDLKLGATNFAVTLSNALGGRGVNAFFAIGATRRTVPLGGGCDLLVAPDMVFLVAVQGSGPGNGTASVKMALPSDPKLRGAKAHLQWGVVDPSAKGIGVAFTRGATLTL